MIDYNEAVEWCEKHREAREEYNKDMKRLKDTIEQYEKEIQDLVQDYAYEKAEEKEKVLNWLEELLMYRER